ncbi:MAG: M15 family metallopeptidase [Clostridia bacterium]|nr:M15 family metallopeptidase [Clostridia bacterium]
MATRAERQKAIKRRRIFIAVCLLILALLIALTVIIIGALKGGKRQEKPQKQSSSAVSSVQSEVKKDDEPQHVTLGEYTLDANYKRTLLVNGDNPLPQDFDYTKNLTNIPQKYHNGQLDQINKDVWPYMQAMIENAWKDGVKLYVWSPYRSYDTQKMLFDNQVKRCLDKGILSDKAEDEAATVVARPGTSEHNTGLCADFNMASDNFETTPMYEWMCKNAENYGFILRYPNDKMDITGVIYESWHWRFVGINTAKEMNKLGLTLEEYIEKKNLKPQPENELN